MDIGPAYDGIAKIATLHEAALKRTRPTPPAGKDIPRLLADPVAPAVEAWSSLTRRPLVFVHSDIHRKNIIRDGASYFLDWELVLWGDPVYDLAVHFHKMDYTPAE